MERGSTSACWSRYFPKNHHHATGIVQEKVIEGREGDMARWVDPEKGGTEKGRKREERRGQLQTCGEERE